MRLEIAKELLKPELPGFMAKTLIPIRAAGLYVKTVRTLMAYLFKQVQPMLASSVLPEKLYLTTQDGFFLPPNASVTDVVDPS